MKQVFFLLFVLLSAGIANGQVSGGGRPLPPVLAPEPAPLYGSSMSVIDRGGNLLISDVNYSYATPAVGMPRIPARIAAAKTRLTVVRSNGRKDEPRELEGTVQILGAGYYAVYVVLTTNTVNSIRRQLVAINVDSAAQPAPLAVPVRANVSLSAAADVLRLDVLSFVDPPANPRILTATAAPAVQRFARLITCDGKAFSSTDPIPLP